MERYDGPEQTKHETKSLGEPVAQEYDRTHRQAIQADGQHYFVASWYDEWRIACFALDTTNVAERSILRKNIFVSETQEYNKHRSGPNWQQIFPWVKFSLKCNGNDNRPFLAVTESFVGNGQVKNGEWRTITRYAA